MQDTAREQVLMMNNGRLQDYMQDFEATVLAQAILSGAVGRRETLPVRAGKLSKTGYGKVIGPKFDSDVSFAVDYYGLLKRSTALLKEIEWLRDQLSGRQVKTVECLVVHFASVRIEHVARYNQNLVAEFPMFKSELLAVRGFRTKF